MVEPVYSCSFNARTRLLRLLLDFSVEYVSVEPVYSYRFTARTKLLRLLLDVSVEYVSVV